MPSSPTTFLKRVGIQTHVPGHADLYQEGVNHAHDQPLDKTIAQGKKSQEAWPSTSPDKKYVEEEESST